MFITLHNLLFRLDENEKLFHNEKRQAYVLFCLARVYTKKLNFIFGFLPYVKPIAWMLNYSYLLRMCTQKIQKL